MRTVVHVLLVREAHPTKLPLEKHVSSSFVLFYSSTARIQDLLNSWEFNDFQNGFGDLQHYARV